jgi:hypothetical protein
MKDLIIKLEKRVEELAQQSWEVQSEARDVILVEIRWLESLIADLEKGA